MKQAPQNTSNYQIPVKSVKGFGSYEHLYFRPMLPLRYRLWRHNCCQKQPVFVALSDFADVLLTFLWNCGILCETVWTNHDNAPRRSASVRIPIVWKRQLIDSQTFSSRSEKWLQFPKFYMQYEATTLKFNVFGVLYNVFGVLYISTRRFRWLLLRIDAINDHCGWAATLSRLDLIQLSRTRCQEQDVKNISFLLFLSIWNTPDTMYLEYLFPVNNMIRLKLYANLPAEKALIQTASDWDSDFEDVKVITANKILK